MDREAMSDEPKRARSSDVAALMEFSRLTREPIVVKGAPIAMSDEDWSGKIPIVKMSREELLELYGESDTTMNDERPSPGQYDGQHPTAEGKLLVAYVRIERLEREHAEMAALLRIIQWKGVAFKDERGVLADGCPFCRQEPATGHLVDCRVGVLLARLDGKAP